jgi:hypothetical protein
VVGRRWWAVRSWKLVQKSLAIALATQLLLVNGSALAASLKTTGQLTETAPPKTFLSLRRVLDQYQPQIKIISPKAGQLLSDNTVTVSVQLQDLPIYKDKILGLGPHLHLVVDDQPHRSIYDANEPIVLRDLEPGTHTVRIFAASPWDEAFKNDGSFAQVTFDIFTKTDDNRPQTQKPLLTYNQPQGTYGAEPILLDFYVTNAPLHLIAQESDVDSIQDWKVKATINGQSFLLDRWQPTYLKGFKPGKNWVQLEFIDEKGNRVENLGNNTARIFNYEPGGQDPLAQLTRGEISIAQAKGIVDPTYTPPAPPKPIEPDAPAAESTKSVDMSDPVKLLPDASKIVVPVPIIPIAPIPKALESKAENSKTSIEPIVKPVKPIEIKPDLEVKKDVENVKQKQQKATPSIISNPDGDESPANSASKRAIQYKLPSFVGPGKKIDVKTVVPPAIVPEKPVEPKADPISKTVTESKVPNIDADAPEPKALNIDADAPKKGNWFDRFRKSDKPKPDLTVKDLTIQPDVPIIVDPLPVIEKPVELKADPISKTLVEPKAPNIDEDAPKKGNWFDRFRKSDKPKPDLTVKDLTIQPDALIIVAPLPSSESKTSGSKTSVVPALPIVPLPVVPTKPNRMSSPPVLELTKDQKLELSTQKKSAIETRKPFNLFGPGKKDESPAMIPSVAPSVKPNTDPKPDVVVKDKIQNTIKPITRTPIVIAKPEVVKPEAVKPEIVKSRSIPKTIAKSEAVKPEVVRPIVITKPEIVKPEVVKPRFVPKTIVKPEIVKPEVVKPIVIAKPEIVKPEVVKPENTTKSEEPKSAPAETDSLNSLVDRLNKKPTPTEPKPFTIPTEPSITGDELFNQLKSKFNRPQPTPETPPIEIPASKTAG